MSVVIVKLMDDSPVLPGETITFRGNCKVSFEGDFVVITEIQDDLMPQFNTVTAFPSFRVQQVTQKPTPH